MHRIQPILCLVALLPTCLTACGGSDPAPALGEIRSTRVEGSIAEMIPANAVAYLQIPSIDAAQGALDRMRARIPAMDRVDVLTELAEVFQVEPSLLDSGAPLGVTVWISERSMEPGAAFLVPALDADALASAATGKHDEEPRVRDNYVAITTAGSGYVPGGSEHRLAESTGGDVSAVVDLKALIAAYRPMLDGMIGQVEAEMDSVASMAPMPGMDMGEILGGYLSAARSILDSADEFRLSASVAEGEWGISMQLTTVPGSPLATLDLGDADEVGDLVEYVDTSSSMLIFGKLDMSAISGPMMEYVARAMPGMMDWAGANAELFELYGGAFAGSFGFGDEGMRMGGVYQCDQPETLLAEQLAVFADGDLAEFGIRIVDGPRATSVAGVEVHRLTVGADPDMEEGTGMMPEAALGMQMMFGEAGMVCSYAALDDRLLVSIGGDEAATERAVERFRDGGGELPEDLARGVAQLDTQSAGFLVRLDLAQFLLDLKGTMGDLFGAPSTEPTERQRAASVPVLLHLGVDQESTWSLGISVEPSDIPVLAEIFDD